MQVMAPAPSMSVFSRGGAAGGATFPFPGSSRSSDGWKEAPPEPLGGQTAPCAAACWRKRERKRSSTVRGSWQEVRVGQGSLLPCGLVTPLPHGTSRRCAGKPRLAESFGRQRWEAASSGHEQGQADATGDFQGDGSERGPEAQDEARGEKATEQEGGSGQGSRSPAADAFALGRATGSSADPRKSEPSPSPSPSPSVEEALRLDAGIPPTAHAFLQKVSSPAYGMRSRLEQTVDSGSFDVVEANPWGAEAEEKRVYVLAQGQDQLYTMRTRRARREVAKELDALLGAGGAGPLGRGAQAWRGRTAAPAAANGRATQGTSSAAEPRSPNGSRVEGRGGTGAGFRFHVEDVREGLLVFEEETAAAEYCSVLEQQGHMCVGIAQVPAAEVFTICQKSNALAVLFRRGVTPPGPDHLQRNLRARRHSFDD
eukprot:TRINITY_DN10848_c0_g1_i1.p1 TRINITY_DN10848_c0_g1~~TRINITY_DN10848_c0_g1_i1.p1  ORF type:complete len:427 (-),score=106.07 TRINITY_DN10848_c0_g1_i1:430-1710(-)